jgi:hypothetical protein
VNVLALAHEAASVGYHPLVMAKLATTIEALVASGPDGLDLSAMWTPDDVVVAALLNASGLVETMPGGRRRLTEGTRRRLKPTREAPC